MTTNIQPVVPPSHASNAVTEAEAAIRERLAVLESSIKTDEQKIVAWVGKQWPHFVTWLAVAAPYLLKHLP